MLVIEIDIAVRSAGVSQMVRIFLSVDRKQNG